MGFPGGAAGKDPTWDIRDSGSIPGLRRSPGGGHGNPLQFSCLENPMDRGACQATVHGVRKSWTQRKYSCIYRLPGGTSSEEPSWQSRRHKKCRLNPCVRKIPWMRSRQLTPVFLSGESQGQRSLAGCCPGVTQSQTRLKWLSTHASVTYLF